MDTEQVIDILKNYFFGNNDEGKVLYENFGDETVDGRLLLNTVYIFTGEEGGDHLMQHVINVKSSDGTIDYGNFLVQGEYDSWDGSTWFEGVYEAKSKQVTYTRWYA